MNWLTSNVKEGDILLFHYCGHGNQLQNQDNSKSLKHSKVESLCPLDYKESGCIMDEEIIELLIKPLPKGAKLILMIDTGTTSTILNLAGLYNEVTTRLEADINAITYKGDIYMFYSTLNILELKEIDHVHYHDQLANIIGLFSNTFYNTFETSKNMSYAEFMNKIRLNLNNCEYDLMINDQQLNLNIKPFVDFQVNIDNITAFDALHHDVLDFLYHDYVSNNDDDVENDDVEKNDDEIKEKEEKNDNKSSSSKIVNNNTNTSSYLPQERSISKLAESRARLNLFMLSLANKQNIEQLFRTLLTTLHKERLYRDILRDVKLVCYKASIADNKDEILSDPLLQLYLKLGALHVLLSTDMNIIDLITELRDELLKDVDFSNKLLRLRKN